MLEPGAIFGGTYRLEKLLGKGGMGEVWLAQHLLLREPRAIKLILGAFGSDSVTRDRFVQGEARNALRLEYHPAIVRTYELGLYEDTPYIVMEYVEGGVEGVDLKDLLRSRGKLSIEETGAILQQLAGGLEIAHQHGLVHRDIKPANILIDRKGRPKLSDFGLTKHLEGGADLTTTGYSVGTPAYMSPEQAYGKAELRSDIYSLGAVLYHMLTGQAPFSGAAVTLLMLHANAAPTPLQLIEPSVPEQISAVVLRALEKEPAKRYQSALELASAYRHALAEVQARNSSSDLSVEAPTQAIPLVQPSSPVQSSRTLPHEQAQAVLAPPRVTPNNLPAQLTSFIGREEELAQAQLLLKNTRMLTLMGAGGTGKTRLSIEVANRLLDTFPDGIWFVELAPLTDPSLVVQELASLLKVREEPGQLLITSVADHLRDKLALVILDNCEHLVEACARLAEELLRACPKLRILASSREGLGIGGETTWRVPSLSAPNPNRLPSLEKLTQYEAVRLFVDRATSANPKFQVTNQNAAALAQLCYQLDGIPLALELAAVRIKAMTVEQIAARLDNRFKLLTSGSRTALPRQQTLRALIDWSYDLLPENERAMLTRLSVFAGGWTLEDAEAVCVGEYEGGAIEDFDVIDLLMQMVNKSLAIAEEQDQETRYRMLVSIRQYAQEKLIERGEAEQVKSNHCAYYLKLSEKAEPALIGPQQTEWLARLEQDHDNLRTALGWSLEAGEAGWQAADSELSDPFEVALRFGGALWRFWMVRGYLSEGRQWLEAALTASGASTVSSAIRAKALKAAGTLSNTQNDPEAAREYYKKSLELMRQLGDRPGVASLLNNLGVVAREQGDHATARIFYEKSLAQFRVLDNKFAVGQLLNNLGLVARDQGDLTAARAFLEESLTIRRGLKDKWGIANTLDSLGDVTLDQKDFKAAHIFLKESLRLYRELGDRRTIAALLDFFAGLAAIEIQSDRSARLAGAAHTLRKTIGAPLSQAEESVLRRRLLPARQTLSPQAWLEAWEAGQAMTFDQAVDYALEA